MNILAVEKQAANGKWLRGVLEARGHDVTVMPDADLALATLVASNWDLLICEAYQPGLHGAELVQRLREQNCQTPALLLYPAGSASLAAAAGEFAALARPFSRQRLVDSVQSVASRESLQAVADPAATLTGGLPGALLELARCGATGMLHVTQDAMERRVTVRGGAPTYVWASYSSDNFGRFLVRRQVISEEQLEESHVLMISKGIPQGEALIGLGFFQQVHLFELLRAFQRERLLAMFTWPDPQLEFRTDEALPPGEAVYALDPIPLVFEGYQRHGTTDVLFRWETEQGGRYVCRTPRFDELYPLLQSQWPRLPLAPLTTGLEPLHIVLRHTPVDTIFAVRTLRAMLSLEMVELTDQPCEGGAEPGEVDRPKILGEYNLDLGRDDFDVDIAIEQSAEVNAIYDTYLSLQFASYYELLGVAEDADNALIEGAHLRLREHYEVLLARLQDPPDVVDKLREILDFLGFARAVLQRPDSRLSYDAKLKARQEQALKRRVSLGAESRFKSGLASLRAGKHTAARIEFEAARALRADDALCGLYASWATYLELRSQARQIGAMRQQLQDPARLSGDASGFAFHAWICLDLGFVDNARQAAAQALNLDAANADATEVLAAIEALERESEG